MQKILDFYRNGIHYHVFQFNGSGTTIKSIGAYETIEHAVSQGANVVVNVTSGNNGDALKDAARQFNKNRPLEEKIKVVHIIGSDNRRLEEGLTRSELMWDSDAEHSFQYSIPIAVPDLKTRWLTPEDRASTAKEYLEKNPDNNFRIKGIVDVTHYVPNVYVRQSEEILQHTIDGEYLDFLAFPLGTGRASTAFYAALKNLQRRGIPINTKLIGIVPEGENPIYHRFVFQRKRANGTLEHVIEGYNPKSRADKLSCPDTDLMPQLMQAMEDGQLSVVEVNSDTVEIANKMAFREGGRYNRIKNPLELEDSASVGFALADFGLAQQSGINQGDNVGVFITGRGIYASPSWELERMKIERHQRFMKEVRDIVLSASIIAGGLAGLIGVDYAAKQMNPAYREFAEQRNIYNQKTYAIHEIIRRETLRSNHSMLQIIGETEAKYKLQMSRMGTLDFPEPVVDEIIVKYLEQGKDKIKDSRDMELDNTLRSLVLQSRIKSGLRTDIER